ncbi:MAG: hypothetical protein ACR2PM_01000 [Hyphomicrobiales bacterium]
MADLISAMFEHFFDIFQKLLRFGNTGPQRTNLMRPGNSLPKQGFLESPWIPALFQLYDS